MRCKSRNPNLSTRELLWLTLFPQDHDTNWSPGDQLATAGRGDNNQSGGDKRRSITSSFYSVGNNIGRCQEEDQDNNVDTTGTGTASNHSDTAVAIENIFGK